MWSPHLGSSASSLQLFLSTFHAILSDFLDGLKAAVFPSRLIPRDAVDCNQPVSSAHGIAQSRILEWVSYFLLQGIFPTPGLNPHVLHLQADFFNFEPPGKPSGILLGHEKNNEIMPFAATRMGLEIITLNDL